MIKVKDLSNKTKYYNLFLKDDSSYNADFSEYEKPLKILIRYQNGT